MHLDFGLHFGKSEYKILIVRKVLIPSRLVVDFVSKSTYALSLCNSE